MISNKFKNSIEIEDAYRFGSWALSDVSHRGMEKRVSGFILCMFEMELANQIMGSAWEYVGKR